MMDFQAQMDTQQRLIEKYKRRCSENNSRVVE